MMKNNFKTYFISIMAATAIFAGPLLTHADSNRIVFSVSNPGRGYLWQNALAINIPTSTSNISFLSVEIPSSYASTNPYSAQSGIMGVWGSAPTCTQSNFGSSCTGADLIATSTSATPSSGAVGTFADLVYSFPISADDYHLAGNTFWLGQYTPGVTYAWSLGDTINFWNNDIANNVVNPNGGGGYSGGGDNGTSIAFNYPSSTQTSTGPFSAWLLAARNLRFNGSYEVKVQWTATDAVDGATTSAQAITGDLTGIYPDWFPSVLNTPGSAFDYANDQDVTATALLLDSQDPSNPGADLAYPVVVASSTINFTLLSIPHSSPSSTLSTGGTVTVCTQDSSGNISCHVASGDYYYGATNPGECIAPLAGPTIQIFSADIQVPPLLADPGGSLRYGLCLSGNFLTTPTPALVSSTAAQFNKFMTTPPFSIFFNLTNIMQAQLANNTSSPSGTDYSALTFNQSSTFLGNNPVVLMTSSSLADFIGEPAKEAFFTDFGYFLWFLYAAFVTATIWLFVKGGHHQKPK